MTLERIKKILDEVKFAPSNVNMGWEWDVKPIKVYDENGTVLEKGFNIRTTFMRPDVNTGEIDKGYGSWRTIHESASEDAVVKSAWVCVKMVVEHELMEAFTYKNHRVFDPHKTMDDLMYNARTLTILEKVKTPEEVEIIEVPEEVTEIIESNGIVELGVVNEINNDVIEKIEDDTINKIHHTQNIDNHQQEISKYLKSVLKQSNNPNEYIEKYSLKDYVVFHNTNKHYVSIAKDITNAEVARVIGEDYTLDNVEETLSKYLSSKTLADPSDVNEILQNYGYTQGTKLVDDEDKIYWEWRHRNKDKTLYISHSEIEKGILVINEEDDVVDICEGDDYTIKNINEMFKKTKI